MWEVETLHWRGEWINTWAEDGKILSFRTREEAQDALDDLLLEMPDHEASDYRIVLTKE